MISIGDLPTLNAALNGTSAVLLTLGYLFIRRKKVNLHKACMVSAFVISTLFLVSYLTYHYHAGSKPFPGEGWTRPLYFAILISHVILATVTLPLSIVTLARGIRGRFEKHRSIARWALPIWLYVSVTGVVVYLMLYRW
ncbi:MAG: DUF420 domain-containing protein [Acidobacteria bacterium]|nr:DUF420 domain-containing protein [Acidobacteriota bacterium]TDI07911.1 MAG: DUF420 domain-containing protein [Acidobacteriota bacterium]